MLTVKFIEEYGWDNDLLLYSPPIISIEPAFGVRSDRNGYVFVPATFQLWANAISGSVGIGYQHDIPLPVRRLFLTARLGVSYRCITLLEFGNGSVSQSVHSALVNPEVGLKYVLRGRVNLGLDLLGMQVEVTKVGASVTQRVGASVGINL